MNVVLPFLGPRDASLPVGPDPLEQLLIEAYTPDMENEFQGQMELRDVVTENHFPDQSMYILERQLQRLKESLERMRFYLGDLDDLLPSKKR